MVSAGIVTTGGGADIICTFFSGEKMNMLRNNDIPYYEKYLSILTFFLLLAYFSHPLGEAIHSKYFIVLIIAGAICIFWYLQLQIIKIENGQLFGLNLFHWKQIDISNLVVLTITKQFFKTTFYLIEDDRWLIFKFNYWVFRTRTEGELINQITSILEENKKKLP